MGHDGESTGRPERGRDRERDGSTEPAIRIWPIVVVLLLIPTLLLALPEAGTLVGDNRLSHFLDPVGHLRRAFEVWTPTVNLGRVIGNQDLVVTGYVALLDTLGAPPWLIQRTLHITVVAAGAIGVALVTREFVPRSYVAPLAAGLWWVASPFTSVFLLPSVLYLNAATAPWMALALIRGTTTPSRWRWAAVFALTIAVSVLSNAPGLVLAALPLIPIAGYLVWSQRTTWRRTIGWLGATAPLVLGVTAFDLFRTRLLGDVFEDNLSSSESAEAISRSSSWSESLRGLGNWLTYWNPSGRAVQHWMLPLLDEPSLVLLSFVPVVAAVTVVAFSAWRPRLLFGFIVVASTALMVGMHPLSSPSPLGRLIERTYDEVPALFVFRNLYKAGAGWAMATAVLLGYAAAWLTRHVRTPSATDDADRSGLARTFGRVGSGVALVAIAAALIATSSPLWTGSIYDRDRPASAPPPYWDDALEWLDAEATNSRVLILPGRVDRYRWGGAPNGDLFVTYLDRPFVVDAPLAQPSAETSNVIHAVSDRVSSGSYVRGMMGPIMRRLGIAHVVLRNDVVWEEYGLVRPANLDSLRNDPDLRLVASFGEPGENVTRVGDQAVEVFRESEIPPVEVYELVPDADDDADDEPVRAVDGPSLLVSGDGAAWPILASRDHLDGGHGLRYTANLSDAELADELGAGSPIVITDTNRRVPERSSPGAVTLGTDDGPAADLFGSDGSQSVAVFADAVTITDLAPAPLLDPGTLHRPAAAFDGTEQTAFLTGSFRPLAPRAGLRVDLRSPSSIDRVRVTPVEQPGLRRVETADLVLSTGDRYPLDLGDGIADVTFEPREIAWFEIVVTGLGGDGVGAWGFHEIEVDGLDLRERIRLPDDIARAAARDQTIATLLEAAPIAFEFDRHVRGRTDLEPALLREFRLPAPRELTGRGALHVADELSDHELARLLDRATYGVSTARLNGSTASSALRAFDGDETTAWSFHATDQAELEVVVPRRTVSSVVVQLDLSEFDGQRLDLTAEAPTATTITAAATATVERPAGCDDDACSVVATLTLPSAATIDHLLITIGDPDGSATDPPGIVRVPEVRIDDEPNPPFPISVPETCHDWLAELDGEPLGVRLFAPPLALFDGRSIAVDLCDSIVLDADWHSFTSGTATPFSWLTLSTGGFDRVPTATSPAVEVSRDGRTRIVATVDASERTRIISGSAPSRLWNATAGGADLGAPILVDAQMAWAVPADGQVTVVMSSSHQRISNALAVLFAITLLLCIALVVIGPRSRREPVGRSTETRPFGLAATLAIAATTTLAAGLISGLLGLVLAALVWSLRTPLRLGARHAGGMAVALVVTASIATVAPVGGALADVNPEWPNERALAWHAARLAAVMILVSISLAIHRHGRPVASPPDPPPTLPGGGGDDPTRPQYAAPKSAERSTEAPDDRAARAPPREVHGRPLPVAAPPPASPHSGGHGAPDRA